MGRIASSGASDTSSSSAIPTFEGTIRVSPHSKLNLSHNDVILGVNTKHTTAMVSNHVVNIYEHVITKNIDGGGIVWHKGVCTHIFQHTNLGESYGSNSHALPAYDQN